MPAHVSFKGLWYQRALVGQWYQRVLVGQWYQRVIVGPWYQMVYLYKTQSRTIGVAWRSRPRLRAVIVPIPDYLLVLQSI